MPTSVSCQQVVRLGMESVASAPPGAPAARRASATTSGETPFDRMETTPIEGSAFASPEAQVSLRRELSKTQAAVWIRVLLRLEAELPLARLAEELGLSDHQFGMALGLLIREGKARIRDAPAGLRVVRVEATGRGGRAMPYERR